MSRPKQARPTRNPANRPFFQGVQTVSNIYNRHGKPYRCRWRVLLSCGHERLVAQVSYPVGPFVCYVCREIAKEKERN